MPFVMFPTVAPAFEVAVNPAEVVAAAPDAQAPDDGTELLAAGTRQILVLESLENVVAKLGTDFRELPAASTTFATVYINRKLVLHVLPHPQVAGVCFVHARDRRIAVNGSLADVVEALS